MTYDDALIVLGLTPDSATLASVKKAYAQAAKQHRPEQDPEGFANIRLAYERVQEALKSGNMSDEDVVYESGDPDPTDASTLAEDIARAEHLDLATVALDTLVEQHRLEVLDLEEAWQVFLSDFFATQTLPEADRGAPQVAALNTALLEPALEHYLSRQAFAEKLGWLMLEEANSWVSLDALKLAMKTFNYELYGWHNQSWTLHSLLEIKTDSLREKMIFLLAAQQSDTPEQRLFKPMNLLSFAKLWFFKRKQAADLKKRLHIINTKHMQWADILNTKQVWRVENWPNTFIQLLCVIIGLMSMPICIFVAAYINIYFLKYLSSEATITTITTITAATNINPANAANAVNSVNAAIRQYSLYYNLSYH